MKKIFLVISFLFLAIPTGYAQEQQFLAPQIQQQILQMLQTQQQMQKPSFVVQTQMKGAYSWEMEAEISFLIKQFLLNLHIPVLDNSNCGYGSPYGSPYGNQNQNQPAPIILRAEIETDRSYGGPSTGPINFKLNLFGNTSSNYAEVKTERVIAIVRLIVIRDGQIIAMASQSDSETVYQTSMNYSYSSDLAVENQMRNLAIKCLAKALQDLFTRH